MNNTRPPGETPPVPWSSTLRKAIKQEGILGKSYENKEIKIKHYFTPSEMGKHKAEEATIIEIYDMSRVRFEQAEHPKEKALIAHHLVTLIDLESAKLKETIKEMNATWRTALKAILVATVILMPLAAMMYLAEKSTIKDAKQELEELNKRLSGQTEFNTFIVDVSTLKEAEQEFEELNKEVSNKPEPDRLKAKEAKEKYFGVIDQTVPLFNKAFLEKLAPSNDLKEHHSLQVIRYGDYTHKSFETDIENMINQEIKIKNDPSKSIVEMQIYKDYARGHLVSLTEKIGENSVVVYKSQSGIDTIEEAKAKEHLKSPEDIPLDIEQVKLDHVTKIVKAVEREIDDKKWSDVILAVCHQGIFTDFYPLQDPNKMARQWKETDGTQHEIMMANPDHHRVNIERSEDNKIQAITVESGGRLRFYDEITKDGETKKQPIDYPLNYHLSMKITLDEAGQPKVAVERREFTRNSP